MHQQSSRSAKLLAADLVERIFTTLAFKGDRITAAQMAVMLEHVVICRDAVDDGGSDSGGAVSRKRATAGWRRWAEVEARAGVALCDADGDGFISRAEFEGFIAGNPTLLGPLSHLEALFNLYDKNGDKCLSLEELHDVDEENYDAKSSALLCSDVQVMFFFEAAMMAT